MLKMYYAMSAIGLMFIANFAVLFSKKTKKKFLQILLWIIAAVSLIGAFLFMLGVLFGY